MQTCSMLNAKKPMVINRDTAKKLGLKETIILQQMNYWITEINEEKGKDSINYKNGYYWTYNTYEDWQEQIPFCSKRTIRRKIKKLEKMGFLISNNFNKMKMDRTKWYRINYEALDAFEVFYERNRQNGHTTTGQVDHTIQKKWTEEKDSVDSALPKINNTKNNNTNNNQDYKSCALESKSKNSDSKNGNEDDKSPTFQNNKKYTPKKFFNKFKEIASTIDLPVPRKYSSKRAKKISTRLKSFTDDEVDLLFSKLKEQDYLSIDEHFGWFDIDFLIRNDENFEKVMNKWMEWKWNNIKSAKDSSEHGSRKYQDSGTDYKKGKDVNDLIDKDKEEE